MGFQDLTPQEVEIVLSKERVVRIDPKLLDALQTQSQFAVRDAVVHGVDLARAV